MQDPRVIVALDFDDDSQAMALVKQLDPAQCKLKVGKEMFTLFGPAFVKNLVDLGFDVFLDLKFHDIPNTVAKACKAAADLGVWMVNVHASGGKKMMQAAKEAIQTSRNPDTKLTAVTVLTSMDAAQLNDVVPDILPEQQVSKLARLAYDAGVDGVVCSAQEASMLRSELGSDFLLVTPGIRPEGSDVGDQIRIMTPKKAMEAGVSYMVIGRPITKAEQPLQSLLDINSSF